MSLHIIYHRRTTLHLYSAYQKSMSNWIRQGRMNWTRHLNDDKHIKVL